MTEPNNSAVPDVEQMGATSGLDDAADSAGTGGDDVDGDTVDAGVTANGPVDGDASEETAAGGVALLVREGDIAADYLEQLLDIIDYDGDIDLDVENGRAVVAVVGSNLGALIGPGGTTLDALQELTRLAVQQQTGNRSRLMLDVSGHRSTRRKQLTELAQATARNVTETGHSVSLAAMNPFERKVVHDAIAEIDGVRSESDGVEPERRVVVHPA